MQTVLIILRAIHTFAGIASARSVFRRRDRYPAAYSSRGPAGASFFQDFTEQPRSVAFLAGVSLLAALSGVAPFWLVYGLSGPFRWRSGSSRSGGFSRPSRKTRSSSRRARGIALAL